MVQERPEAGELREQHHVHPRIVVHGDLNVSLHVLEIASILEIHLNAGNGVWRHVVLAFNVGVPSIQFVAAGGPGLRGHDSRTQSRGHLQHCQMLSICRGTAMRGGALSYGETGKCLIARRAPMWTGLPITLWAGLPIISGSFIIFTGAAKVRHGVPSCITRRFLCGVVTIGFPLSPRFMPTFARTRRRSRCCLRPPTTSWVLAVGSTTLITSTTSTASMARIPRSPSRANMVPMSFGPSRTSTTTSCVTRRCVHT